MHGLRAVRVAARRCRCAAVALHSVAGHTFLDNPTRDALCADKAALALAPRLAHLSHASRCRKSCNSLPLCAPRMAPSSSQLFEASSRRLRTCRSRGKGAGETEATRAPQLGVKVGSGALDTICRGIGWEGAGWRGEGVLG